MCRAIASGTVTSAALRRTVPAELDNAAPTRIRVAMPTRRRSIDDQPNGVAFSRAALAQDTIERGNPEDAARGRRASAATPC